MTCPTCGQPQAFDVLGWLDAKGVRLRPAPAYVLRYLFEHAGTVATVEDWSTQTRTAPSTLAWWMQKKGLPAPARWLALARGQHIAAALQSDVGRTVERVAFSLGHEGHGALCHHVRRTFGLNVTEARHTDALTLAERWWSRQTNSNGCRIAA